MKPDELADRRLVDGSGGGSAREQQAAALLRQLPPAAMLDPSALARVQGTLSLVGTRRRPRWSAVLALTSAAASLGCVLILTFRFSTGEPPVTPPAVASAPGDDHRARIVVPAVPTPPIIEAAAPQRTTLKEGRLAVKADRVPIEVEAGSVLVTVPPGGAADIEVISLRGIRIAGYGRVIDVRNKASGDATAIQPGTVWTSEARPTAGPTRAGGRARTPASKESDLAAEARLIGVALRKLRREHDAAGALASLDNSYRARFPNGMLAQEEAKARVEALITLRRPTEALRVLDGIELGPLPRDSELVFLRGELRADGGRCAQAIRDFDAILSRAADRALAERALHGRASCRSRLGDQAGARSDLEQLLARFPDGRFAADARRALGSR